MNKIIEYITLNYTWFLIGAIIILLAIIGSYADKTNFGQGKNKNENDKKEKDNLNIEEATKELKEENLNSAIEASQVNTVDEIPVDKEVDSSVVDTQPEPNNENLTQELAEPQLDSTQNITDGTENSNTEIYSNNSDANINDNGNLEYLTPKPVEDINQLNNENINPVVTSANEITNLENVSLDAQNENVNSNNVSSNIETAGANNAIPTLENFEDIQEKQRQREIKFEENFNKFDEEFNTLLPKKDIIEDDILEDIDSLSLDKTQKFNFDDIPDLDDVELPKIKNLKTEDDNIWKF